jgi:Chaperone of endosialidase
VVYFARFEPPPKGKGMYQTGGRKMKRVILTLFLICGLSVLAEAQTTAFNYQGSLQSSGSPATGSYDFEFLLFDSLSDGSQVGSTITQSGVSVAGGIFSVTLDFGSNFPGATRFLEIHVRTAGGGAFTPLTPRQPLSSTPYAVKSLNADTATNATQLGGVAADQYVQTSDTRLTDSRNPLPGNVNYIQNQNAGPQASSNYYISGIGRANILDATTQFNINGNRVFSTPGTSNVFAGISSGVNNTGGSNSFFGYAAGQNNTNGAFNSFFGTSAGEGNTSGSSNNFFGALAGQVNTGDGNDFFGTSAGWNNTSGNFNSFFGHQAGLHNTTGSGNSFFGEIAGYNNNTGINNSFFGGWAGSGNSTGSANAFFGYQAGSGNSTGNSNAFFGEEAGYSNTTGATNAFFGGRAGRANSTGVENSFFGYAAGSLNTTGFFNAFFGEEAGTSNTTGANNSFVGFQAGFGTSTGGNNTLVGNLAGSSNQTGNNNTIVGALANVNGGSLTNAGAIGANAMVATSNSLVLGSINGVNGATANTKVGIGTTSPSTALDVQNTSQSVALDLRSTVGSSTLYLERASSVSANSSQISFNSGGTADFAMGTSQGSAAASDFSIYDYGTAANAFTIQRSSGNIGIGTTAPSFKLHVNGETRTTFLSIDNFVSNSGGPTLCASTVTNRVGLCTSSLRYKSNIDRYSGGLDTVRRLRPITFEWKENGMHDFGLAAEEVEKVDPQLVFYNKNKQVEGVKYDHVGVVLVNAVKEQQTQIEAQDKKLAEQSRQILSQQAEIEALKSIVCRGHRRAAACRK